MHRPIVLLLGLILCACDSGGSSGPEQDRTHDESTVEEIAEETTVIEQPHAQEAPEDDEDNEDGDGDGGDAALNAPDTCPSIDNAEPLDSLNSSNATDCQPTEPAVEDSPKAVSPYAGSYQLTPFKEPYLSTQSFTIDEDGKGLWIIERIDNPSPPTPIIGEIRHSFTVDEDGYFDIYFSQPFTDGPAYNGSVTADGLLILNVTFEFLHFADDFTGQRIDVSEDSLDPALSELKQALTGTWYSDQLYVSGFNINITYCFDGNNFSTVIREASYGLGEAGVDIEGTFNLTEAQRLGEEWQADIAFDVQFLLITGQGSTTDCDADPSHPYCEEYLNTFSDRIRLSEDGLRLMHILTDPSDNYENTNNDDALVRVDSDDSSVDGCQVSK